MKRFAVFLASAVTLLPAVAHADNWQVRARVTMVEASHVGYGPIYFQIDQAAGNCGAGSYLSWNPQGNDEVQNIANGQGVLALLMTAKTTGQIIRIVGDQNGCAATLMYMEQ